MGPFGFNTKAFFLNFSAYKMGISRDPRHKRRATGGRKPIHQKKRKYELGRQASMTKLGAKRIHLVRVRGGNQKHRALRLDTGNYSWGSEATSRKSRILAVCYNASNNELVRTNTLVKSCIVQIDATPFRQWYEKHYAVTIGQKKKAAGKDDAKAATSTETGKSRVVKRKLNLRQKNRVLDAKLDDQFATGRLYAAISSRPGQSGRADGYILEGKELEFYLKKMTKKRAGK
eukprot:c15722_g1_i1.p1 GENE.c15722_g1_i1~~c15722_g1_i1.p1  ORF type:complete len:231 (-),score=70.41 c15722_g1_i1:133-825(-)